MTDVFKLLPPLSWRDVELPCVARSAGFGQRRIVHQYVNRDGGLSEPLGNENWWFRYSIPFREGIAKGPYKKLFLVTLPQIIDACRDRSPGPLYDPVLGSFRCECVSFEDESDVRRRDGDDVRIGFEYSPLPGELDLPGADLANISIAKNEAGALDAEVGEIFRSRQKPPPEPLVNPLDAIDGIGRQIDMVGNQMQAKIADFVSKVEKLETTLAQLEEPKLAPTIRSARRLRDAGEKMKDRLANPGGRLITHLQLHAAGLSAVAAALGVPMQDLLRANPALAKSPEVPANTSIRYFASG